MNAFAEWWMSITTGITLIFMWMVLHRIAHPHKCQCGYETWFIGSFKRHILKGHKWV